MINRPLAGPRERGMCRRSRVVSASWRVATMALISFRERRNPPLPYPGSPGSCSAGLRARCLEGHGALEGRAAQLLLDRGRTTQSARVDRGLGRLLDHTADQDGELRGAMEHQDAVVG